MIYISLTTVPKRLIYWMSFKRNLDSLLNQKTNRKYYVILNVPQTYVMEDNAEYIFPKGFWSYANRYPRLIINRDTYDYGPIIKIYGALNFAIDLNDIIIALDDDNTYHEDMIECHLKKMVEYPKYSICFAGDIAGKKVPLGEDGKFLMLPHDVPFPLTNDEYMISPGHNGSVSYRRWFLKEDFNPELFALGDGDDPLMGYYFRIHNRVFLCAKHDYLDPFPITDRLPYPHSTAGDTIRGKSSDSIHGRLDQKVIDVLFNYEYIYKEN